MESKSKLVQQCNFRVSYNFCKHLKHPWVHCCFRFPGSRHNNNKKLLYTWISCDIHRVNTEPLTKNTLRVLLFLAPRDQCQDGLSMFSVCSGGSWNARTGISLMRIKTKTFYDESSIFGELNVISGVPRRMSAWEDSKCCFYKLPHARKLFQQATSSDFYSGTWLSPRVGSVHVMIFPCQVSAGRVRRGTLEHCTVKLCQRN